MALLRKCRIVLKKRKRCGQLEEKDRKVYGIRYLIKSVHVYRGDRVHDTRPKVEVTAESMNPFIQSGYRYVPVITERSNGRCMFEVFFQDMKDKPYRIRTIRDEKIWDNSMASATGTTDTRHLNQIFHTFSVLYTDNHS
ncbi:MAG: hypothetical protein MJ116_11855 [Lachnospiraceae bacterium]|nr:hypothetical protein [Lachnospiraceae bacterium]